MTIQRTTTTSTSPTSVRCSLDKVVKKSLVSSLKRLDPLSSNDSEHSTFTANDYTKASSPLSLSSSSSSSSTAASGRRKVRFLPLVRAKDTISRHDMTKDEIQSCFLQDRDYNEIWEHNKRLVRRAKNYHSAGQPLPSLLPETLKGFEDDMDTKADGGGLYLCTRGLESTSKGQRFKSIDCVLEEQDFQIMEGYYDEEILAEIYAEVSAPSRFRAVYLAMEDRIEAGGSQKAATEEL